LRRHIVRKSPLTPLCQRGVILPFVKGGEEEFRCVFFLCDQVPIQRTVLNRFGEVGGLDILLAFEVGNGPGHL